MIPQMLATEEVLYIYEVLVADFKNSDDPISPAGVKNMHLLESAVARQEAGYGHILKYPDSVSNAATLLYGLCCDHPFHNGNKRTALVAMLVHLDKNKLALYDTSQAELYQLMLRVADRTIAGMPDKRAKNPRASKKHADEEVAAIAKWLGVRASKIIKGERVITYRELRRILAGRGYHLENPVHNSIGVYRYEQISKGIFKKKTVLVPKRIGSIGWPGETRQVAVGDMKKVRALCRLREEDGVDSDSFYNSTVIIDGFVNRYRKLLRKLARV